MRGQWMSTTRKMNRHYQSGAGRRGVWSFDKSRTEYYGYVSLNVSRRVVGGSDPVTGFPITLSVQKQMDFSVQISAQYPFNLDLQDLNIDTDSALIGAFTEPVNITRGYSTTQVVTFRKNMPALCAAAGATDARILETLGLGLTMQIDHSYTAANSQMYHFEVTITEV